VGVSTAVRRADRYADPLRRRTFKRIGKAVIHPSRHCVPDEGQIRVWARSARNAVDVRENGAKQLVVVDRASERSEDG